MSLVTGQMSDPGVVTTRTGRRFRAIHLMWLALLGLVLTSCDLAPIPGPAPLRYRDPIFSTVTKTSDIVYGSANDKQGNPVTLTLDLYAPTGDTVMRRPLIVWVHGGSFKSGDKTSPELVDESNTFAKKGYVNASINYRLRSPGCTTVTGDCPKAINDANADAQTAIRFLRSSAATYHIDPTRIAIGGSSAGAITALQVGYRTASPGATPPSATSDVSAAVSLSGALILGTEDPGEAPALLFHGTNDPLVPYDWAKGTVDKAHAAGDEALLITWQGGGHVPYVEHRNEILALTRNFLYRKLDAANAEQ